MTENHLSEQEIQEYVLGALTEPGLQQHIATCPSCKAKLANYTLVFSGLQQLEKPQLEFDITSLVMPQVLPKQKQRSSLAYIFAFAALILISFFVYLYRAYFLEIFVGFSSITILLIAITTLAIAVFHGIDIYKKYQQRIEELNYY